MAIDRESDTCRKEAREAYRPEKVPLCHALRSAARVTPHDVRVDGVGGQAERGQTVRH
jgi:hypothetical protein